MQQILDEDYLKKRASIDYDGHDEIQMGIIVDKICDELIRRYGNHVDLIKNPVLRMLVSKQKKLVL